MKVSELVAVLLKAPDQGADVVILDKQYDVEMSITSVDFDATSAHIIVKEWPSL